VDVSTTLLPGLILELVVAVVHVLLLEGFPMHGVSGLRERFKSLVHAHIDAVPIEGGVLPGICQPHSLSLQACPSSSSPDAVNTGWHAGEDVAGSPLAAPHRRRYGTLLDACSAAA
jgi:hypothetical protein